MTFHSATMRMTKKEGKKRVFSHFLTFGLPTLDMVLEGAPAPDSWDTKTITEGDQVAEISVPVYTNPELEFAQVSLTQRIQGLARTREAAGQSIHMSWADIAEAGNAATYNSVLKSFRDSMAVWLEDQACFSEAQQAAILSYTNTNSGKLLEADEAKKERVGSIITDFVSSLEDASEYGVVVGKLNHALETTIDEADF